LPREEASETGWRPCDGKKGNVQRIIWMALNAETAVTAVSHLRLRHEIVPTRMIEACGRINQAASGVPRCNSGKSVQVSERCQQCKPVSVSLTPLVTVSEWLAGRAFRTLVFYRAEQCSNVRPGLDLELGRRASSAASNKTKEQEEQQEKGTSRARRFGNATALQIFHFQCGQLSKFRGFHRFCFLRGRSIPCPS
jgi:hypothetical protein